MTARYPERESRTSMSDEKPGLKMKRSMAEHGWRDDDPVVVWLNETIERIEEFEGDCQRFADAFNYALQGRDFDDVFPWHFTTYVIGDTDYGGISTPNGVRPDGTMHTYWTVTGETWEPFGRLIVEVVNSAARALRHGAAAVVGAGSDKETP
jgi:hypothetical protein